MINRLTDGFANENERREHARTRFSLICWARSDGQPWATDELVGHAEAHIAELEVGV